MNKLRAFTAGLLLGLYGCASATTFQYFTPATGVLKGNASTYVTAAAVAADITAMWSGTCNGSSFLRGDGACVAAAAGSVTSVGLTVPTGLSVSGSPVTTSGVLAITTTLSGVLKGTGSGFTAAADSDVISLWSGTCDNTTYLRGDGTCFTPAGGGGGTPGGSDTNVQYNDSGAFAGDDSFSFTTIGGAAAVLYLGGGAGNVGLISPPDRTSAAGMQFFVSGGGTDTGAGGLLSLKGGLPTVLGAGGSALLGGSNGVGSNQNGGSVNIQGGAATGSGTAGSIIMQTANVNRLTFDGAGAWLVGSGSSAGTAGYVIASAGAGAAPAWTQLSASNITTGTLPNAQGGTGVSTGLTVLSASNLSTGTVPSAAVSGTYSNALTLSSSSNAITAATGVFTAATVGGSAVCRADGTNCPAGGLTQSTGSWTLNFDEGCSTTPQMTGRYVLTGNHVSISFTTTLGSSNNFTCTSDSVNGTADTSSNMPVGIRPARNQYFVAGSQNNGGAWAAAQCNIQPSGLFVCFADMSSGAFTASGARGLALQSVSYNLN